MYTGGGNWSMPQSSGGHPNGGLYPNGTLIPPSNYTSGQSQLPSSNTRINLGISPAGGSSFQPSTMIQQLPNGLMPPPSIKSRIMQLQDQKLKAAKQRWHEQQQREQAKKAEQEMFLDLFNAPIRESDSGGSNVTKVLGVFSEAQPVISNRSSSCIGIDYQPPTPAPSSHHTIGDDDDDRFLVPNSIHNFQDSDVRNMDSGHMNRSSQNLTNHDQFRTQNRGLPPPFPMPQSLRTSENHNSRPSSEKSYVRSSSNITLSNLTPPTGPARPAQDVSFSSLQPQLQQISVEKRVNQGYPQVQQSSAGNHLFEVPEVMPSQSRLKQVSKALPKLSLDASTDDVQEMLALMRHPVRSPLGGIVTPRVDLSNHMGNTGRLGIPKYTSFTAGISLIGSLESPPCAQIKCEPDLESGPVSSHSQESSRGQTNTLGNLKGPCLSEDSDSDNHKSNKALSLPIKLAPVTESSKPKSSSGESSSNESSSYDSSSDEDEKITHKLKQSPPMRPRSVEKDLSGSDDDNNIMGSDNNDYSLQSLMFKAKSTHSPHGPNSNLSQHQPSPKNSEAFPNTINILAMPGDCISDQLVKDDEDAMSNYLCQPLPELIEPISSPFSTRSSSSLKPSLSRHLLSDDDDSPVTQVNKSRGSRQTVRSPLGKSPTKKQQLRRTSDRISNNSDEEFMNHKTQLNETHRLTPSRTPSGRPLPRASATPALKSPSNSDENADESFHPGKRQQNYRAKSSRNQNRMPKKPTPKVTYSSSSSDEEVEAGFSGKQASMNNLAWKNSQKRGSRKSDTSSIRGRGSKVTSLNQSFKSEPDEDDEKSEKDVSNKKTAISMIFAGSKAGKGTGKSGIKVEIQTQGPTLTPASQVSLNSSPPTVAIKSQGLSHAATLISHSPVHLLAEQKTKNESSLKRRPDGRPVLICCIPLAILSPGLSEILSRQKLETFQRKRKISDTTTESSNQLSAIRQQSKKSKIDCMISSPQTSSSTDSANLMPPPNQVFYSYMENRRSEEEEYADIDVAEFTNMAKRMKHEGDLETVSELQSIKYIRSVLYLSLAAIGNEVHGEKPAAFLVYKDSLDLLRKIPSINSSGSIGSKLSVLSNRCQSLLYLRMYKLRRQELKECQKILGDHLLKASTQSDSNSPNGQQQTISPTPSPAGSEGSMCSKSSGYTSANELTNGGLSSLTTPSLTVPQNVMQKQHIFVNYLSQCHEIWDKADISAHRSHCEDFIIRLDRMFGPLTLHSSIKDLVKYTQAGIDLLLKEKEANA